MVVDPCTDVGTGGMDNILTIYPNPFSENVTLTWNLNENHLVELFDMLGNTLGTWNTANDHLLINAENLQEGVYYIRSSSGSGVSVMKVIKLK